MNIFNRAYNSINELLTIKRKGFFSVLSNSINSEKEKWNKGDFLNAYDISLYANACVRKRAEKVGEVQFILKKGDKEIKSHKLLDLLYKPNKFFSGQEFWELYQKYKDLTGSAYILKLGDGKEVSELHLLRPDLVEMVFDKDRGEITKYKYDGGKKEYPAEQVIASHYHDPKSQLNGYSLLTPGINAIKTEDQLSKYHASVLKNGGKIEGVFNFKTEKLSRTQLEEMRDSYKKQFADAKKSGAPLFLGGEADYKNIGLTPTELSFLVSKNVTMNDILMIFGVPKAILAQTDDVKYDNADASIKIFLRETIKPLLRNLVTKLDADDLVPKDMDLDFIDPTPEDVDRKLKELEIGDKTYSLTINEKRAMLGLDPIKDGDQIFIPFSVVPMSDLNNQNQAKKIKSGQIEHPLRDPYVREKYWNLYIKRADKREAKFISVINTYFKKQEERMLDKLQPAKTRVYRRKNLMDDLFDKNLEIKLAIEAVMPLIEKFLEDAGIDAMTFIGSRFEFNITSDIKSWLDKKAKIFARSINETTFEKLKDQFQESLDAGEDRNDLVKRIEETYGNINKTRANMIARTEVQAVSQKGTFEGYRQANMPIKIWVAVRDNRTREWHADLDGMEVPLDQPFHTINGNTLMFPGDPNAPAEEVINCRCTI